VPWKTHAEAELRIEVDVVIPGQPIGDVQLALWQSHHF
jgi:hypothetical protein